MLDNIKRNKRLWLITAVVSLVPAFIGVFYQNIYIKVASRDVLSGMVSQDLITIVIGLVLLIFSLKINKDDTKKQILSLSFLAYLFYAYGIYVIEQIYNSLYIIYIIVFALSFWALVYGLININTDKLKNIKMSKLTRYITIGFLIFIPVLFYILWTKELLPLMQEGKKIEFMYSIYILDMAFVLPAFLITAFLIIKRKVIGYIFAPLLFFKAFTLLFSVGLGGLLKPLYNLKTEQGENMFYILLSLIFLALAILNYWKLDFKGQNSQLENI